MGGITLPFNFIVLFIIMNNIKMYTNRPIKNDPFFLVKPFLLFITFYFK